MKNNFIHTVLRFAARIFAVLCMRFRFLPPYMAGSKSKRLLQTSLNDIINRLFWHRRKPAGFRAIISIFRPTARNGVRRRLPNRKAGATK
jgi:hypothetical protein